MIDNKKARSALFLYQTNLFLNDYLGAGDSFTRKFTFAYLAETNNPINCRMNSVITADKRARTGNLSRASLTN